MSPTMSTKSNKNRHLLAIVVFIITALLNYLSAAGILLPNSQQDISDRYANLLAPTPTTFSIWGVIYLVVILTLIAPWIKAMSDTDSDIYYRRLMPGYIAWMLANILWTITWTGDWLILSLVAILAYTGALIRLVALLDAQPSFAANYRWLITFPLGLHTGWLIFASFTNLMALLVKQGIDPFSNAGVALTILFMVLAVVAVLLVFARYDNAMVTVPALWALFGIFMKHRPGSDFAQASTVVTVVALVLLALALLAHFKILSQHRERRPAFAA